MQKALLNFAASDMVASSHLALSTYQDPLPVEEEHQECPRKKAQWSLRSRLRLAGKGFDEGDIGERVFPIM
jgi:hypothetical protein